MENLETKLFIGLVGLPARGKSYISKKLNRFLSWIGYNPKVFNIGNYRRDSMGVNIDFNMFFDSGNQNSKNARDYCAILALKDVVESFNKEIHNVAIFDGTNTTVDRRILVTKYLKDNLLVDYRIIWIESICDIEEIIMKNIYEAKINSPDYIHWEDKQAVILDFLKRIESYNKVYEKLDIEVEGEDISFIKIINQGHQIVANNLCGYLESKILSYIVNLHTYTRCIYFCRHGESENNILKKMGGDSNLSELGRVRIK